MHSLHIIFDCKIVSFFKCSLWPFIILNLTPSTCYGGNSIQLHYSDINPLSFTGARVPGTLLHMYWGHLTRGSCPKHSASSECHVWTAADSEAQHGHFRGAWERTTKEVQHLRAHSDEQLQTQGMHDGGFLRLLLSPVSVSFCLTSNHKSLCVLK